MINLFVYNIRIGYLLNKSLRLLVDLKVKWNQCGSIQDNICEGFLFFWKSTFTFTCFFFSTVFSISHLRSLSQNNMEKTNGKSSGKYFSSINLKQNQNLELVDILVTSLKWRILNLSLCLIIFTFLPRCCTPGFSLAFIL